MRDFQNQTANSFSRYARITPSRSCYFDLENNLKICQSELIAPTSNQKGSIGERLRICGIITIGKSQFAITHLTRKILPQRSCHHGLVELIILQHADDLVLLHQHNFDILRFLQMLC